MYTKKILAHHLPNKELSLIRNTDVYCKTLLAQQSPMRLECISLVSLYLWANHEICPKAEETDINISMIRVVQCPYFLEALIPVAIHQKWIWQRL